MCDLGKDKFSERIHECMLNQSRSSHEWQGTSVGSREVNYKRQMKGEGQSLGIG